MVRNSEINFVYIAVRPVTLSLSDKITEFLYGFLIVTNKFFDFALKKVEVSMNSKRHYIH